MSGFNTANIISESAEVNQENAPAGSGGPTTIQVVPYQTSPRVDDNTRIQVSGNGGTVMSSAPQQVNWIRYFAYVKAGADLTQPTLIYGQSRSDAYGNLPYDTEGYELVEVGPLVATPDAWKSFLDLNTSQPLEIVNGQLVIGAPVSLYVESATSVLRQRMTQLMQITQQQGWGVFATMPADIAEYGKQLAALQSVDDLTIAQIPNPPADLEKYL